MCDWREAVHCRNRAELLRSIADRAADDEDRQSLRKAAEHYDKVAAAMEREVRRTIP